MPRRRFPTHNPISEGWFGRGTPIDHLGTTVEHCPQCSTSTTQDVYRAILSRHGGLGAPFFLQPLLQRTSTRGKWGTRSRWSQCHDCRSVLPRDEVAAGFAASHGHEQGFLNRPS